MSLVTIVFERSVKNWDSSAALTIHFDLFLMLKGSYVYYSRKRSSSTIFVDVYKMCFVMDITLYELFEFLLMILQIVYDKDYEYSAYKYLFLTIKKIYVGFQFGMLIKLRLKKLI
jgi:hypothetical protein